MSDAKVAELTLKQIIERKLAFLLENELIPWKDDSFNLGERDALKSMLNDCQSMSEDVFQSHYMCKVEQFHKRMDEQGFSSGFDDEYDESFSNTVVSVLALVNPLNLYDDDCLQ